MAVHLHNKMGESKTIQVEWGPDTVDVSYHPNVVTPALLEEVDEAAKRDNLDSLGVLLEPVLEWWDVLGEDNERIPTDAATIRSIPMRFLILVQRAIEVDQNPPADRDSVGG